jgi:hypothetical protein
MNDEPIDYGLVDLVFTKVARYPDEASTLIAEAQDWPSHPHGIDRVLVQSHLRLAPLGFFVVRHPG